MRFERINPTLFRVVLSQRNLLTLLAKLRISGSFRTIYFDTDEGTMAVSAEPDRIHYLDRAPPGDMSPAIELEIQASVGEHSVG